MDEEKKQSGNGLRIAQVVGIYLLAAAVSFHGYIGMEDKGISAPWGEDYTTDAGPLRSEAQAVESKTVLPKPKNNYNPTFVAQCPAEGSTHEGPHYRENVVMSPREESDLYLRDYHERGWRNVTQRMDDIRGWIVAGFCDMKPVPMPKPPEPIPPGVEIEVDPDEDWKMWVRVTNRGNDTIEIGGVYLYGKHGRDRHENNPTYADGESFPTIGRIPIKPSESIERWLAFPSAVNAPEREAFTLHVASAVIPVPTGDTS